MTIKLLNSIILLIITTKTIMKQHSTYQDLSNMLSENKSDMDAVDFIELCTELYELITKLREQAQEEINQNVEQLVDSFGGENCTMRDLKGDL